MAKNCHKMATYELYFPSFFLTNLKIKGNDKNCDLCCSFDPIKILSRWALQNESQNLSFVKSINEVANKWPEILLINGHCAFRFETEFSTTT